MEGEEYKNRHHINSAARILLHRYADKVFVESKSSRTAKIYKNRFYYELYIKNFNIHRLVSLYLRDAKS